MALDGASRERHLPKLRSVVNQNGMMLPINGRGGVLRVNSAFAQFAVCMVSTTTSLIREEPDARWRDLSARI